MQLISLQFLIFLPAMALIYFLIPAKLRYIWLFLISWGFYLSLDLRGFPVLLFTTVSTYVGGRVIEKSEGGKKKAVLAAVIIANLTVLALSKYTGLTFLSAAGMSFFMFMAIGYLVDVYRGDLAAEKNFLLLSVFISFFPVVTSGPIERAGNMLRQFRSPVNFSYDRMRDGLLQMMWGYFMKMVIADRCAIIVGAIYDDPVRYAGTATLIASILYTFEIYCDFSGYSNIAIGCAKVLGFDLMKNFDAPYMASTVQEFWRRWHILLSSWFRDYVYIPLGGSRKGKKRTYINIFLTMLVSGLWHGSTLNFLIWGAVHGLWQVIHRALKDTRPSSSIKTAGSGRKYISVILSFLMVNFLWIPFRAETLSDTMTVISRIITMQPGISYFYVYTFIFGAVLLIIQLIAVHLNNGNDPFKPLPLNRMYGKVIFCCFLIAIAMFAYFGNGAFIYAKF